MKHNLRKLIFPIFIVATAMVLSTSCSKKSGEKMSNADLDQLEEMLNQAGAPQSERTLHIDSLAFMADDLTPAEATNVLATYMKIINTASQDGKETLRLETMRKFVDVYDIVMGADASGMTDMFKRLAGRNPNYNIIAAASEYRAQLSDYAAGSADEGETPYEAQKPDSTEVKADNTAAADSI